MSICGKNSRKKVIALKMVVLLLLWGGVVLVIVKFLSEYNDRKKDTVTFEAQDMATLSSPSMYMSTDTLTDCEYVLKECMFTNSSAITNCSSTLTKVKGLSSSDSYIMDERELKLLGAQFTQPTDLLRMSFILVSRKNGSLADFKNCAPVSNQEANAAYLEDPLNEIPGQWQTVILLSDTKVVDAFLEADDNIDPKSIGSLSFVGYGQSAHYSFSLEQEFFIGSSEPKNKTVFGTTQYPYVNKNALQLLLSPSTFTVRQIKHNRGQSLFQLMGSIFGWFGILVGASFFSMFCDLLDLFEKGYNAVQEEELNMKEEQMQPIESTPADRVV